MFHLKPSRTWCWHVKAYFLGQAWMPDHKTCTQSQKINQKYLQHTCPMGQARYSFHLPFSSILQILLARGNGASTNVEPLSIGTSFPSHTQNLKVTSRYLAPLLLILVEFFLDENVPSNLHSLSALVQCDSWTPLEAWPKLILSFSS